MKVIIGYQSKAFVKNVLTFKNYAFTVGTPKVAVVRQRFKVLMCSLAGYWTTVFRSNYAWLGDGVTSKDVCCWPVRTAVFSETLTRNGKWKQKRSTKLKKKKKKEQSVNKGCSLYRDLSSKNVVRWTFERNEKHSVTIRRVFDEHFLIFFRTFSTRRLLCLDTPAGIPESIRWSCYHTRNKTNRFHNGVGFSGTPRRKENAILQRVIFINY